MQAKDIPDTEFLTAVGLATVLHGGVWANRSHVAMVLGGYAQNVAELRRLGPLTPSSELAKLYIDPAPGYPEKVVLAKARKLIRRGLLDGCYCGCRGDFELTHAGLALIQPPATTT